MTKTITFESEMQKKLLEGMKIVSSAVASTLGPGGRTVIIEPPIVGAKPMITKDGVSVASAITELEDPVMNLGAGLIKSVAKSTNEESGDGTSTSTILAAAIMEEGMKSIVSGVNPIHLRNGIIRAVDDTIEILKQDALEITSKDQITQVASISSNDDKFIGELISDAIEKVGRDGVITVAESSTTDTYTKFVEGMQFDKGYISAYFCSDPDHMTVEMQDPLILIYDGVISSANDIAPALNIAVENNRSILIIAEDVIDTALSTAIFNFMKGVVRVCAIKSPGFGEMKKETMMDLAILTGSTLIDPKAGMSVQAVDESMLGSCKEAKITATNTTIIDGYGDPIQIDERIKLLRSKVESASGFEKEKFQERLAKLAGGIAVINVGAKTETELREKKHRIEDAVNATRAAISEGIVPGGGVELCRISAELKNRKTKGMTDGESIGYSIVTRALEKPIRQIAENAGIDGAVIASECVSRNRKKKNEGFDALHLEWVDMIEAGIVDPVKVTRSAIQNASSIIALALTSSCTITSNKDNSESH